MTNPISWANFFLAELPKEHRGKPYSIRRLLLCFPAFCIISLLSFILPPFSHSFSPSFSFLHLVLLFALMLAQSALHFYFDAKHDNAPDLMFWRRASSGWPISCHQSESGRPHMKIQFRPPTLVAFQTQTQDRCVLPMQFPKSQPCPRW